MRPSMGISGGTVRVSVSNEGGASWPSNNSSEGAKGARVVATFAGLAVEGRAIVPSALETYKLEPLQDEDPRLQSVRHLSRRCDIQVEDNNRGIVLHY